MICPHLPRYGYKKTMDFHAREGETGYGSNLVLPNYFYPKYNFCSSLISSRSGSFQCQKSYLESEEFRIQQRVTSRLCEKA